MGTRGHLRGIPGGGADVTPTEAPETAEREREALEELERLTAAWIDRLAADSSLHKIFLELRNSSARLLRTEPLLLDELVGEGSIPEGEGAR